MYIKGLNANRHNTYLERTGFSGTK